MRKWNIGYLYLFLLTISTCVSAQVNIEKIRTSSTGSGFSGYTGFDVSHRSGNVSATEISIENRADYLWQNMKSFVFVRGDYGWARKKAYSDEALAHARHIFRIRTGFQPEFFTQIDYNKKKSLDFRGLICGGIRLAIYRHNESKLWFGTAFMLEHEQLNLDTTNSHDPEITVVRWSNYLTTGFDITEQIQFAFTTYLQPCVDDFKDIRVLNETNLSTSLIKKLSLSVTFRLNYDSQPPDHIKYLDTSLKTGLVMKY
ncbi:MAG: DUF481 domain-containing protein [Candidatus Latescibacteria bacterium]|nr:DUF481 domain-containing protein [Candidatus Latescibacterota bacterium]